MDIQDKSRYSQQNMPKKAKLPGKKAKYKDAPKKPISAFFCYQKMRRENIKKENPKMNNKELVAVLYLDQSLTQKMSEEWRTMDEKSKEPYEKMAEKEKERYEKEKKEYEEKKKAEKKPGAEAAKAEQKPKEPEKKEEGKVSAKKSPEKKPQYSLSLTYSSLLLAVSLVYYFISLHLTPDLLQYHLSSSPIQSEAQQILNPEYRLWNQQVYLPRRKKKQNRLQHLRVSIKEQGNGQRIKDYNLWDIFTTSQASFALLKTLKKALNLRTKLLTRPWPMSYQSTFRTF
eukprot:TRINITY_DN752_c1_g1_i1.p3 TRINITY_DN752_c1_g1~~TRINITY_DN752_c1_g1_i1.p3  ORF type:complete len:286 (+),score=27.95 TRINITY_DN752_c1_g1_i1:1078-1935(+)